MPHGLAHAPVDELGRPLRRGRGAGPSTPSSGGSDTHTHTATHNHGGSTSEASHAHSTFISNGGAANQTTLATATSGVIAAGGSFLDPVVVTEHAHQLPTTASGEAHNHGIEEVSPSVAMASSVPEYREFVICEQDG